ncbi:MAG: hypothetical protein DRI61_10730 [Chloroflexi bacterium]|nr:MAG: hypothetical protein DRI61_10730 [Chloroflexota bacterium]HDN79478.1 GntR family transcriptional regulator [Chloroflexota bacterium]
MKLSEKAYQLIKEKIITLELRPLSVINERELMEELGLGRTPIREALYKLAHEDLVIIVPRRGMFVADISITDLLKLFELRVVLEGFCARLAAERRTEEQLAEADALLNELRNVSGDDYKALMDIDERLHKLMYEMSDNEFLIDILNRLYDHSLRLWYLTLDRLGNVRSSIEEHIGVMEAIKAGDGETAEKLIQQHIIEFQQKIKDAI